jgi:hypothetical protein
VYPQEICAGELDLEDTGLASRREEYSHPSVAQASKECSLIKALVKSRPSDPRDKGGVETN